MPEELIMRGSTPSGTNEKLSFGGNTEGHAYRLISFDIYPSASLGVQAFELAAAITADDSEEDPANPNFNNPGLIGTVLFSASASTGASDHRSATYKAVINDLFYITQDLIISAIDTVAGSPMDVNWQCKFEKVKLSGAAQAVANFKQFTIYDE